MTRNQQGFTLVEILVAIGVATLLVSLVYGAVRVGQKSTAAMGARMEQAETMRIGWLFLYDTLTHARAVQNPLDESDESGFFGTATEMSFVADMPAYVGPGGLVWLSLSTDESAEERQLVLTLRRYVTEADATTEEPLERAVLVDDVETIDIAYYGQAGTDEPAEWQDEWQDMDTLPNLVKISIKPTDSAAWPQMIARPMTGSTPLDEEDSPVDDQQAADEDQSAEVKDAATEDPP